MKVPYGELSGDELAIIYKDVTLEMMRRAVLAAMTTEAEDEAKVEVQPSESSTSSPGEPQGERQGEAKVNTRTRMELQLLLTEYAKEEQTDITKYIQGFEHTRGYSLQDMTQDEAETWIRRYNAYFEGVAQRGEEYDDESGF